MADLNTDIRYIKGVGEARAMRRTPFTNAVSVYYNQLGWK